MKYKVGDVVVLTDFVRPNWYKGTITEITGVKTGQFIAFVAINRDTHMWPGGLPVGDHEVRLASDAEKLEYKLTL